MTTIALTAWNWSTKRLQQRISWVSILAIAVALLGWQSEAARDLIVTSLADAYIQVSTFVALTLALFYGLEKVFNIDAAAFLARNRAWQVPIAAFLGALPGCGGAIVVVTQYVRGNISFGAVLAVLTATMGDAAFLLLAQAPMTGLMIFGLGFVVGTATGMIVDAIHGPDFLRQSVRQQPDNGNLSVSVSSGPAEMLKPAWVALMIPGIALAILTAFQIDVDQYLSSSYISQPAKWLGVAGSLSCLVIWALTPAESLAQNVSPSEDCENGTCHVAGNSTLDRVINDTNFVTAWVVLAFLTYELAIFVSGVDLKALFQVWAPVIPLIGILLGLLPGCGPQVLVTTLYLNGVVPMSAQLGNAISNDGDALFPAIALAPKVALVATIYSAIPALIIGYGYWFLFE